MTLNDLIAYALQRNIDGHQHILIEEKHDSIPSDRLEDDYGGMPTGKYPELERFQVRERDGHLVIST